jgi:predicted transcriptional regulator
MRKPIDALGTTEMEILNHVWELKEATVAQVQQQILKQRPIAYSTVLTIMRNLTTKNYLTYRVDGVTYIYQAIRQADEVRQSMLEGLLDKVFNGSSVALMQALVNSEKLGDDERDEIRKMIESL